MMGLSKQKVWGLIAFSIAVFGVFSSPVLAQNCEQWAARAVSVQGVVETQKAGEAGWRPVKMNDEFCPGDQVRVLENSRADLALASEAVMRLNANSTVTIQEFQEKRRSVVDILKGAGHFFSRQPKSLEVRTPFTVAGVRGTEFYIRVDDTGTFLSIFEGNVLAANKAGELNLVSGQSAFAEEGRAPVLKVVVKPRDAIQWVLYYPPTIYTVPGTAAPTESDPRFYVQQASELLSVGQVRRANSLIQQALSLDENFSDAYALQTIIFIVQNDKDRAMQTAQRAVDADPNSPAARIALSYAQQASFDLEGARDSLEKAVELAPDNALAWARLAEIHASFGRLGRSLVAAQKAVSIDPNLSRTQTVLGFAYLTQVETSKAREAFEKAIQLDQADPLPRLGLGLAIIRDGGLQEGGRQIEIAASLDPNNSLIRSYLGKTYFEEKRTGLDLREYEIAKELDPNDPTPYFYSAIAKQTTNRPVEALRDFETAKELNDNRAVYRSKLLLDSDLAARSAATARIYNDLGFGQLGLVEGYRSVNADPTNFSAHRFLADTYATLPRHEIARVSELLQSQLLQPINITPIQPGLAESNLFLISAQGAAQPSFNEFNPLFTRNRAALQASGLYGSNDTWAGEGIASGIYKGLSLSAGYTHFETDGWRSNADQQDDIANIFAQYEFSYKTSIQAEYRYRDTEKGDTQLRFFPVDFFPDLRRKEEIDGGRFGFHHAFTPTSILIGNLSYQDKKTNSIFSVEDSSPAPSPPFPPGSNIVVNAVPDSKITQDSYGAELQHLFRSMYLNFTTGAGYFKVDGENIVDTITTVTLPPPLGPQAPVPSRDTTDLSVKHTNIYLYSYINFLKSMIITLGASGDFFDSAVSGTEDRNQINPKFGVTWNPITSATFRGAAFRTLKRTLITDQTLEPTQVAGFNQFYDDATSTDTWLYGAGYDQKLSKRLYGGLEFLKRESEVPAPLRGSTSPNARVDWEEYLGRAYIYWTPSKWLSLSAEYIYEKFDYAAEFNPGAEKVKTHRVPLGVNFFLSSGFTINLKGTYYNQEGQFLPLLEDPLPQNYVSGSDDFWIADSSISYRLPKRYGLLTFGVTNLFDEKFSYYDTDVANPQIRPERFIYGKVTLAIP